MERQLVVFELGDENFGVDISSVESDVQLEKSARVKAIPRDKDAFPFVILLPEMVRWYPSFSG